MKSNRYYYGLTVNNLKTEKKEKKTLQPKHTFSAAQYSTRRVIANSFYRPISKIYDLNVDAEN